MPFLSWVGNVPGGAAGGVLTGTYPNPGIAIPLVLQGTAANTVLAIGTTGDANAQGRTSVRANGTIGLGTGAVGPDVFVSRQAGPLLQAQVPFDISNIGSGLQVAEGTNAKQGTATLNGTTNVVVANTSVTANSRIFLTHQSNSGVPGVPYVTARTAGTSFTIVSTASTDLGTVAYEIIEPG